MPQAALRAEAQKAAVAAFYEVELTMAGIHACHRGVRCMFSFSRWAKRCWLFCVVIGVAGDALAGDEAFRSPMLVVENGAQRIELSAEQIDSLPQHRVSTRTNWVEGVHEYEGPLVRDVLALVGVDGKQEVSLRLRAWDDYTLDVSADDYFRWDVILAQKMAGNLLTIEHYGPLCVIYPRDQHPELKDSRYDHRWVFMLKSIEVRPQ